METAIDTMKEITVFGRGGQGAVVAAEILAVECNIFPLIEIENGERVRLSHQSQSLPVSEYLTIRGRFRYLTEEEMEIIQSRTDEYNKTLNSFPGSEQPLSAIMGE